MCTSKRVCIAFHMAWSLLYIGSGLVQLLGGIYFLFSLPIFKLGSNIWTGAWNIFIGVSSGMLSCIGQLTPLKQEGLLYLAMSVLVVNIVNIVILEVGEWRTFLTDSIREYIGQDSMKLLVYYAHMTTSISTAVAIVTSFLDTQITFCDMQRTKEPKAAREQVTDIEYVIPRKKNEGMEKQENNVYDKYAQSWVFDGDATATQIESPYLELEKESGKTEETPCANTATKAKSGMFLNPIVCVEHVSNNGSGDRKLHYMRSFSRTPSPVGNSSSSSQDSSVNQPIYEYVNKFPEGTFYGTFKTDSKRGHLYQLPSEAVSKRVSAELYLDGRGKYELKDLKLADIDDAEKIQYASVMVELEQAILAKKEKFPEDKTISANDSTQADANQVQDGSPKDDSERTDHKDSDAEFSKELEAALQLLQDLGSPNTIETPSETCKSIGEMDLPASSSQTTLAAAQNLAVSWQDTPSIEANENEDSVEQESTLAENNLSSPSSPLHTENDAQHNDTASSKTAVNQEDDGEGASTSNGKRSSTSIVIIPANGVSPGDVSESSSGYSSPSATTSKPPTPFYSNPSSVDGSYHNLSAPEEPLSYTIKNRGAVAVISLFPAGRGAKRLSKKYQYAKNVKIPSPDYETQNVHVSQHMITNDIAKEASSDYTGQINPEEIASNDIETGKKNDEDESQTNLQTSIFSSSSRRWRVKSLLGKKTPTTLTPELQGAIFQSESLAYLSELELLARHCRHKAIQRRISEKVHQKMVEDSVNEDYY